MKSTFNLFTLALVFILTLSCRSLAETLTFDCKIEGWKRSDEATELVVVSLREKGEKVGSALLRRPEVNGALWETIIVPAVARAKRGDEVFLQLSCRARLVVKSTDSDIVTVKDIRATAWDSLGVTGIREISEEEFLGVVPKSRGP